MKIACISDTHQHHKKLVVPAGCDMIIHSGDFTYHGELKEVINFLDWYKNQKPKYKLLICGNHEVEISKQPFQILQQLCCDRDIILLNNTHVTIEGKKFFGSPNTPTFGHGWAHMMNEQQLANVWSSIDGDIDVLITHGPAKGVLDKTLSGVSAGSQTLRDRIDNLTQLKLHVFGHIHEDRGISLNSNGHRDFISVNASICGIPYTDFLINPIKVEI
jgi:Icc-related predicted phosphoesterase